MTKEEFDAEEASFQRLFTNVTKAREAIVAHAGRKRGIAGRIACPVCGVDGALKFSIAGNNGHIHAACATPNCVRWME